MRSLFKKRKAGHTLVEILMVLTIIGLLMYMTLSRFDASHQQTDARTTKANLENLRMATTLFYEQEGTWPNNALSDLVQGSPSGTQYISKIPFETVTDRATIVNVANGQGGWVWDTANHKIQVNLTGNDAFGAAYSDY